MRTLSSLRASAISNLLSIDAFLSPALSENMKTLLTELINLDMFLFLLLARIHKQYEVRRAWGFRER